MPSLTAEDHREYFIERARQEAELATQCEDSCAAAVHLKMSAAYLERAEEYGRR